LVWKELDLVLLVLPDPLDGEKRGEVGEVRERVMVEGVVAELAWVGKESPTWLLVSLKDAQRREGPEG
jgi:hypothetical protein